MGGGFSLGRPLGHTAPLAENAAKGICQEQGGNCSGVTCLEGVSNCTPRQGFDLKADPNGAVTFRKELQGAEPFPRYAGKLDAWWGYLLRERLAPVWLSEFGFSHAFQDNLAETQWVDRMSAYVQEE